MGWPTRNTFALRSPSSELQIWYLIYQLALNGTTSPRGPISLPERRREEKMVGLLRSTKSAGGRHSVPTSKSADVCRLGSCMADADDPPEPSDFKKMTTANFKRQLREHHEGRAHHSSDKIHVRVLRRSPSPSGDEGPPRKHGRSMSASGEESEPERHYEKKRSSKSLHRRSRAPRAKSVDSQNLD
ncbi:hypothetical protein B0H14DRAFT_2622284 [Mycena olivaceomarginata]|nr:hypothetical protein B0H14DRAFT_2622284 [Mycena olivaceomarginata]